MRFAILFLLTFLHISIFISCMDTEPLLHPEPLRFARDSEMQKIITGNIDEMLKTHKHSGYNPMELLIKSEFMLLAGLGLRFEILLESYMHIIEESKIEDMMESILKKTETDVENLNKGIEKHIGDMIIGLKEIYQKYDKEDFNLEVREPSTFMSIDMIKSSFEFIENIYFSIKDIIEKSNIEDEMKKKYISTLKNKTILSIFSSKVLLLKMFYDVGVSRQLKMRFIMPGIYYLLVFENGIIKRILDDRLIDEMEYFNGFLENYKESTEELIERTLFHIKEDELPMERKETLYKDLIRMHNDYNEIIDNLISIKGTIIKGTKV